MLVTRNLKIEKVIECLQISPPRSQAQSLAERARRDGVSIAEVIRRLVRREEEAQPRRGTDSIWEIVGIGKEREPLIDNTPVSDRPDLYLAEIQSPRSSRPPKSGKRKPRP